MITDTAYYIGYSQDKIIRYKSASGGIGSEIIKYLLSTEEYDSSMTFVFNREKCCYEPKLIHSFDEYNNCGSVYQDTDTIGFIKESLCQIKRGIVVTCMPCQVKAIRSILNRQGIKSFILSLCCSGQTTIEGTWCYYRFLGIDKSKIVNLQYRGNGWPSGIQITLEDGTIVKKNNWTYPWTIIQQSLLFRPKRCLSCPFKTVPDSDVSLADPWLPEYESDNIGNSVVIINTNKAKAVIDKMVSHSLVSFNEVDQETYIRSQKGTIETKRQLCKNKKFNNLISRMQYSKNYMNIVSLNPAFMKFHNKIIRFLHSVIR